MIKKIEIKNFQSHKETELEFHPGVNVIVGTSDSGKSAIVRALRWAVWNQPLGDGFRSWWADREKTQVTLHVDDTTITRYKTKSDNVYATPELGEFRAFKLEPPAEIAQILNMSELNLQKQIDKHFLFSETSGAVALHFNKIANLEIIDFGIKNAKAQSNRVRQTIKAKQDDFQAKKEELAEYAYLDEIEETIEALTSLRYEIESKKKTLALFNTTMTHLRILISEMETLNDIPVWEKAWESLSTKWNEVSIHKSNIRKLTRMNTRINEVEEGIEDAVQITGAENTFVEIHQNFQTFTEREKEMKRLTTLYTSLAKINKRIKKNEEILGAKIIVSNIGEKMENIKTQKTSKARLLRISDNLEDVQIQMDRLSVELQTMEGLWVSSFPDVCPLCGQTSKTHNHD